MFVYTHKVQYYETDQMGFVHHSNYIRWFEEARSDYFEQIGAPYTVTESKGIFSPVLAVNCSYKRSVRYGETVKIETELVEFGNVRFKMRYLVTDAESGEVRAEGSSEHCFIGADGKVLSLKRRWPEMFAFMKEQLKQ